MPSETSVVQLAGVPRIPSISTRQRRHEPNCLTLSVAQSFGIEPPESAAARITVVPGATETSRPSMITVTEAAPARSAGEGGVPKSGWGR